MVNSMLNSTLVDKTDQDVTRCHLGSYMAFAPAILDKATVISLDVEWWQKKSRPTTEIGIAELIPEDLIP
jgi:hypothetical protein